ncbi:hypothetical protein D3C84_1000980 [compost metagenome]
MIGVGMGFQQPLHLQPVLAHEGDDPVGLGRGRAAGGRVVIKHRVDNRALSAVVFVDHITVGRRGVVKKSFNQGRHGGQFFQDVC